jgi:hypothetical protein
VSVRSSGFWVEEFSAMHSQATRIREREPRLRSEFERVPVKYDRSPSSTISCHRPAWPGDQVIPAMPRILGRTHFAGDDRNLV